MVIERVTNAKTLYVVFLDASLASDATAANPGDRSRRAARHHPTGDLGGRTLAMRRCRTGNQVGDTPEPARGRQGSQLPAAGAILLNRRVHLGNQSQTLEPVLHSLGATSLPAVIRHS